MRLGDKAANALYRLLSVGGTTILIVDCRVKWLVFRVAALIYNVKANAAVGAPEWT